MRTIYGWTVVLIPAIVLAVCLAVGAPSPPLQPAVEVAPFRLSWQVGDRWSVETHSRQPQKPGPLAAATRPVTWEFAVTAVEPIGGRACFRVVATCREDDRQQPRVVFWVDRQWGVLRRLQTDLRVAGEFRTMIETYEPLDGQPSAVLAPLPALPLDLPLLAGPIREAKGLQKTLYETIPGPEGRKAEGQIGFLGEVEQTLDSAPLAGVKSLLHEDYAKHLPAATEEQVVEVRLSAPHGQARQLWQAGRPWPVYSDNGLTTARLVEYTPSPR